MENRKELIVEFILSYLGKQYGVTGWWARTALALYKGEIVHDAVFAHVMNEWLEENRKGPYEQQQRA